MARRPLLLLLTVGALAWIVTALAPAGRRDAQASSPRASLSFRHGGHARIPFDLRSQHAWIRGRLNGRDSVWIVVDTGASSSVMDQGVAHDLGLERVGQHEAIGAGGRQRSVTVGGLKVELAGLTLERETIEAIDMGALTRIGGRPMQLVLGAELFQSCVVRFDYGAGVMDVWEPEHAPKHKQGVTVPMTLIDNHPYIEGTLSVPGRAPLTGRFVIDTGSSGALMITPEVSARESLALGFPRVLIAMGRGVGGDLRNQVGRATSFSIGTLTFQGPIVVMPDPGGGQIAAPGSIGNIGGELLERCRVTFDYPRRTVGFEPGKDFANPFEADMSGVALMRTSGGVMVLGVNPGTPAADAGLKAGDLVRRIDGERIESIDPALLRALFLEEGRRVRLRVARGTDSLDVSFTLKRLL
jgi:predicted aspartyl protease